MSKLPKKMSGVLLVGHGGLEKLDYHTDLPVPTIENVVLDLVAGKQWTELPELLRKGGRYSVAGAIAGPVVDLDVRTLYLKDLSFFGCTYQPRSVFENLIRYIEQGELKPLIAKQYLLQDIDIAQQDFMAKKFVGKLVLLPPQ